MFILKFIGLWALLAVIFIFILKVVLKSNELESCKNCVCLNKDNYCMYLKQYIENPDELNCIHFTG
jgi:hypothetical protein